MKHQIETVSKLFKQKRTAKYIGHFDVFQDNCFQGWVYDKKNINRVINVEVYHDDIFILQGINDIDRSDLRENKIGTGKHGFSIKVDKQTLERLKSSGGEFSIYAGAKEYLLGKVHLDDDTDVKFTESQQKFAQNLIKKLWSDILLNYKESPKSSLQKRENPTWEYKLFADDKLQFPYLKYSAHRMKRIDQNKTELINEDYEELLVWYLDFLTSARHPFKIPISKAIIDDLNEPIRFFKSKNTMSRYAMHFFHANRHNFKNWDLNNSEWYLDFIFQYCINTIDKNLGDILLPQSFINPLNKVGLNWKGDKFPLSIFLERYFFHSKHLHSIDLGEKYSRVLYSILFLGISVDKPEMTQFIPEAVLRNLFQEDDDNKNVITKCFQSVFGEKDLQKYIGKPNFKFEDYQNILFDQGFDLNLKKSLHFTSKGNRLNQSNIETHKNESDFKVQVIGPFEKASGLGQACRMTASILQETAYSVTRYNFDLDNPAPVGYNDVKQKYDKLYKDVPVNLIHLNAESIPLAYAYLPDVYSNSYNIGFFYWELDSPASCHYLAMDLLDEIWVATEYGVQIYKPHCDIDVVNVGMIAEEIPKVADDKAKDYLRSIVDIPENNFVFLTAFDSFSFIQRKNPLGVIKAFKQAFAEDENVTLILKTQNKDYVFDSTQDKMWSEIYELTDYDSRIHIINETFTYKNLLKFKQACDCYVSLHKSEGWGFGMIEAMQIGLPIICTGYSGNLDFCNEENSLLVDFEEEYLSQNDYIFVRPGQKWANPKLKSASTAMRRMFDDKGLRERLIKNGEDSILANFSMVSISKRYEKRLIEIFNKLEIQ